MTKKKKRDILSPNFPKKQEWVGEIIARDKKKVYQENEFHGNTFYRCKVTGKEKKKQETIFVYSNVVNKQIFKDIKQINYEGKRYIFFCERVKWGWILHNWQELGTNLNSKSETILKNHEK